MDTTITPNSSQQPNPYTQQKIITIPTSDPYIQDSPFPRKDSLLQSESNLDNNSEYQKQEEKSYKYISNDQIKPKNTTLSADSAFTEVPSRLQGKYQIEKQDIIQNLAITKNDKDRQLQLGRAAKHIGSIQTPKKEIISSLQRDTIETNPIIDHSSGVILNQSNLFQVKLPKFEGETSAKGKISLGHQQLSFLPIVSNTRESYSKFPNILNTSVGEKSSTSSKRQVVQSSLQSNSFHNGSKLEEGISNYLPTAIPTQSNQYGSLDHHKSRGKQSLSKLLQSKQSEFPQTKIALNGLSSIDMKIKNSSKSVLKNLQNGQPLKGLQFLHPITLSQQNGDSTNESRNEVIRQSASNSISHNYQERLLNNQLSDHIKTLKAQSKQERYKSVEQEFPNMKFAKNYHNQTTFDYDRDISDVFYSIQQANEYDYVGANLKVVPNKNAVDQSANFITKKKPNPNSLGSEERFEASKSIMKSQLKSLIDQSSQFNQSHLRSILNQSAITPSRDASSIMDYLIGSETEGVRSKSQLGLVKAQLNKQSLKNNVASLKDLMADPSSFGVVSQSQLTNKNKQDDYFSNPMQQYFADMSHIPSQSNLQSLANLHSLKALRDASIKSLKVISKRELCKLEQQLDDLEIGIKEKMRPSESNKLSYENHSNLIHQHHQRYLQIFENFCAKLSTKHLSKEKEMIQRLIKGLNIQFKDLSSLVDTRVKLELTTIKELEKEIERARLEFEEFKNTQSIEAYFLKQMEKVDEGESVEDGLKKQRQNFVRSIDDFLQAETLKKKWEQDEEERDKNMDKSKFSGVSASLKDIRNNLKGYKDISKLLEMIGIDQENEENKVGGNVFQREKVVKEIETEINSQIKDVQKTTAKKILARFLKQTQTASVGTQAHSMEELTYDLQRQIDEFKDRGDSLRFEKIQLQIKVDKLQEQLNTVTEQKRQTEKTLTQNCDLMQVEVQQTRVEKARMVEDMDRLREVITEKEDLIKDLERKCEDKDFIQSRLNSLRNKYEEYDKVHGDTDRQMNENQSIHFNEMSEDGRSGRSSSNMSRDFKFQGKILTRAINQADSRQSRNQEYSNQYASSSRGNLLSQQTQNNKIGSALLKSGTGLGQGMQSSGVGGVIGHYKKNSQITESQADTIRDAPEKHDSEYFTAQSPRQRNKTVAVAKHLMTENQKGSQRKFEENMSRPISLGNSPRMNDLKVTITSQDTKMNKLDGIQSQTHQNLSKQTSEPPKFSKELSQVQNSQVNSKASGLKLNAKSHSTVNQQSMQSKQASSVIGRNNNDIMHAASSIFGRKSSKQMQSQNQRDQISSQINQDITNQNSGSKFRQKHELQNSNRFKQNKQQVECENYEQEDAIEKGNNSRRNQASNKIVETLELDDNQQYIVEDEDYDQVEPEQDYLQNLQQRSEAEVLKSKQILTDQANRNLRKSIERVNKFELAALRRVSYLQKNQGEIPAALTKEYQSSISPTQLQYIRKGNYQMQMLIDTNSGDTLRLQQPPYLANSISPNQQLAFLNQGNKINITTSSKQGLSPSMAGHYELFLKSQLQGQDPKYNTSELLNNNYRLGKDQFDPSRIQSHQFNTIQQFPKIRSQVSVVTRKSGGGVPSFSQEELQTYYNKISQNRSSDMIKTQSQMPNQHESNKFSQESLSVYTKEQLIQILIHQQILINQQAIKIEYIQTNQTKIGQKLIKDFNNQETSKPLRNVRTLEVQTDNDQFLEELVAIIKQLIVSSVKEERFKYSDKEYELLLKRASQLTTKLKEKITQEKDQIFMKAGKYIENKQEKKAMIELLNSPSKGIFAKDKERKAVVGNSRTLSPERSLMNQFDQSSNLEAINQQYQSKFRVEDHFKVKLQRRAGGAGDFNRYGEVNTKNLQKDRSQELRTTSIYKLSK